MLKEVGRWISENFFSQQLSVFFDQYLELLGISAIISSVVAPLLAAFLIWLFWKSLDLSLDPRLTALDLENEPALQKAYDNRDLVFGLGAYLSETSANTFEEFKEQLQQLHAMPISELDRLNPDNLDLMTKAIKNKKLLEEISWKLDAPIARSPEELQTQVRALLARSPQT